MEELVDIVMTVYNTNEKYLKKQIESILRQTHKNFYLYISDDNSSNNQIAKILKQYEEKDNRIKIYIQPANLGFNKNFEFLLNKTTANYIMFSDHDDIWYSNKVEKSLEKIKTANVDMVYCNCRQIDENGLVIKENYFKYKNVPLINGKDKLAISRCAGIGCSQIITKDVKEKMLPFKKEVMAHDWLAGFIANEGKGITYLEEPLFDYRLHNTNVFGGRNLSQNISRWKEKNGNGYKSFLEYRKDAIKKAYDDGVKMCKKYATNKENREFCNKAIKYYEKLYEVKKINIKDLKEYFELLKGKNQFKKEIREIALFHFPLIAYLKFK